MIKIREFLIQMWRWFNLELDFEPTYKCGACGVAAKRISRSVCACDNHYLWGVNRANLLGEEINNNIVMPQECGE